MQITLKVRKNDSGRYTLMEQAEGERMPRDCDGDLFMNLDAGSFYRAVASKLHQAHFNGDEVG